MTNDPHLDESAPSGPILVTTDGAVRTITMHRPEARGAFNSEMKTQLLDALHDARADEQVRAVVITGSGRAFCAGQDLKEHMSAVVANAPEVRHTVTDFYNPLIQTVTRMPQPVIAAVNGVAAGAGASLAMACDLRVAARSATFSMAFAAAALSADSGASFLLPRLVGAGRAMRMMLLGAKVPADEALQIGLVDQVVDDDACLDTATGLAASLAAGASDALAWIKASVRFAATHTLDEALVFENQAQQACFTSPNHREALAAFVEKRAPRFNQ